MTLLTFLLWPFKMAVTCSVSLLNTTAFLSAPPVKRKGMGLLVQRWNISFIYNHANKLPCCLRYTFQGHMNFGKGMFICDALQKNRERITQAYFEIWTIVSIKYQFLMKLA